MVKDIYLKQIRSIILSRLKDYRFQLFFFGSQAMHRSGRASDIDIGILPITPLPRGLLSEIREELEESYIPYSVDLVDLSRSNPDFVQRVKQEGEIWNE
ncbi:MAG: nucleotidyltransferase domain-containing protein [Thermodesulfobacteriota bacterium]|nr:nucleotidyltransferase domain-containing protein [Thermodesulfobacteriota bacterium]